MVYYMHSKQNTINHNANNVKPITRVSYHFNFIINLTIMQAIVIYTIICNNILYPIQSSLLTYSGHYVMIYRGRTSSYYVI